MELEYKFRIDDEYDFSRVLHSSPLLGQPYAGKTIHMQSDYYETEDQLIQRERGALRLRMENGRPVVCLKIRVRKDGAMAVREEYECEADTVQDGLRKLPRLGAPAGLCDLLLEKELKVIARVDIVRQAYVFHMNGLCFEIACDHGAFLSGDRRREFKELEIEYVSGSEDAFHRLVETIRTEIGLEAEPLSKFARAKAFQEET